MDHNFNQLKAHILPLSEGSHWDEAKHEWALDHVEVMDVDAENDPATCPCGHFPIVELCWIKNRKNQTLTFVGNVCVKRFLGLPVDLVADGLRRIMASRDSALNSAATVFAFEQGWIVQRDQTFSLDTNRKRKLSQKQMEWRRDINERVLRAIEYRGRERRRVSA